MAELNLINEMLASASVRLGKGEEGTAVKGIRSICKYFGGQMIFLPKFKIDGSETVEELRGVLADAVGDGAAEQILEVLMAQFGGVPLYIPQECRAFRDEVAKEIYERYDGTKETRGDLCREYKMSFSQIYRLYHRAIELKEDALQYKLFDDFNER
ncbi:Mor transcription activator family protein [Treponema pectinovorum]|uniref:Mor transcription activator family protein n=1 Tax=Treponema pectinovorum TaxID=164 RepID=UPI0011CAD9FE|nr:Mor transcription activator family protein [Treponema pectinovorum]